MKAPKSGGSGSAFHLSNLQVLLILLVCGVLLLGGTWVAAGEFGRVPVSLWDICTSVLPGENAASGSGSANSASSASPAGSAAATSTAATSTASTPARP